MSLGVGIEVTRRCNFGCPHCYVDAGTEKHLARRAARESLSASAGPRGLGSGGAGALRLVGGAPAVDREWTTRELSSLLGDLAACGTTEVAWSGGEPLLRDDLEELTREAVTRGMRVGLASNGYFATPERLSRLRASGLGTIQISLDGATRETAARFRRGPKGAFDRAVAAVREAAGQGFSTVVCCILTPETAGEVDSMITFARELGATTLRYTAWTPVGRATGQKYDEEAWARPAVRRFFEVVAEAESLVDVSRLTGGAGGEEATRGPSTRGRNRRVRVLVDCPTGPHPNAPRFRCRVGRHGIYITLAGDVYPCTALMFDAYRAGNVRRAPLRDILFGGDMFKIEREIAGSLPGGRCATCGLVEACRGGCPGKTLAAHGSLRGGDGEGEQPACLLGIHGLPA